MAKRRELCPVCRHAYREMTISRSGDLIYWHGAVFVDRQRHRIGCVITDSSKIRGVTFGPDELDSLHPDG